MLARSSCHLAGYGKVGRRDARPFEPGPGVARFRNVIHSSAATNPASATASDVPFGLSATGGGFYVHSLRVRNGLGNMAIYLRWVVTCKPNLHA